ncbi:MAG TPA: NUDIX hydrolase [Actinocrinis sp.]|uniref:NUDIX hydrolase n=1 Tax=Actinocrinis sp. TaxID=1920516 RepID=UPI002DDD1289|nr:NUDIX hydrolase [Actinocrinis sp.]HEV2347383.1 NUDIX hydrolase [Actinocrinis sp.]
MTTDPTQWIVTEQPVALPDAAVNKHSRLTVAHVTLPDGVQFEQVVIRVDAAAMCVVVNDRAEALMMRRHRFIPDLWVWEVPGGYLNPGESPADAALREAVEETGWRPSKVEHLVTFEPMTGTASAPNHVYLGLDPHPVDGATTDVNEAQSVRWVPLADVPAMVGGMTLGAASVIGLLAARDRLGVR